MKASGITLLVAGILAAAMITATGACRHKQVMDPDVLVTVNGDPVRIRDLQRVWSKLSEQDKQNYRGPQGAKKLLDELITWKLMAQEARRRNLDEDPVVKERIKMYQQQVLVNALLDRSVSDADIHRYYQENFLRCRFIQAAFPKKASAKQKRRARHKAEAIYKKLRDGADFTELARTESDAANAAKGGEMGYVTHSTIATMAGFKVAENVFALKKADQYTRPLEGQGGYYIFQLVEPRGNLDPRGLSPELMRALRESKREEAVRSFSNELNSRADNVIVTNEPVLSDFMGNVRKAWEEANAGTTVEPGASVASGDSAARKPAPATHDKAK